jgi:predicted house-cleaning noncanonical NTP pyrophosphatase (MazG superfamily)
MRITYNKLVRDRVPDIIGQDGNRAVTRVLDDDDFLAGLLAKLVEEAQEARAASAHDLPAELADVLEVLQAAVTAAGMTWAGLLAVAEDKRARRGGFSRRLFLEYVDQAE